MSIPVSSLPPPTLLGPPRCVLAAGAQLGEGARWSPGRQLLWWVDILARQLHSWRPADGAHRHWTLDEEVSAVVEQAGNPRLLLALRRGFAEFDPDQDSAAPRYLHRPAEEPAGNRFNDGQCDAQGRFWAGSMDFACSAPTGALYRLDPDGQCSRHDSGFAVTNGPAWSLDGRTLFFNDTVNGCVLACDFEPQAGSLSHRRLWLRLAEGDGLPDGLAVDAAGRLWIAHWGGSCVTCHDPHSAAELGRVRLPASQVTSCAFGGPDLCTLFITTAATGLDARQCAAEPLAGGLFAVDCGSPGRPASVFGGLA